MRRAGFVVAAALALVTVSRASPADAPAPAEAQKEAAQRFDRGLRLFNDGDSTGALAEFRRAYEIAPNVVVLYNLGLVYAQSGRAVEATDTLDKVLADPAGLPPDRVALAHKTRDEQAARIAELTVHVGVDGASIDVDTIEVGTSPLAQPLRITGGAHVIGASAQGYAPKKVSVMIAGREKQKIDIDLVPMQGRIAHLIVKTRLPGATLFADDQRIGTTPFSVSISLPPGAHRIELRRPGYVTAKTEVNLGDGASGEVTLEPAEDPTEMATVAGHLALRIDEPDSSIGIDGQSLGAYIEPLRLAAGVHHLTVDAPNFEPYERDVEVTAHSTADVRVHLVATPEYRVKFAAHSRARKVWSVVTGAAGLVLVGTGVGLRIHDAKVESSVHKTLAVLPLSMGTYAFCDTQGMTDDLCQSARNQASAALSNAQTTDYVAWSAIGVGGAAIVLGTILLLTTDDPRALDTPGASSPGTGPGIGLAKIVPTFWWARSGGGLGWEGTFR
jgi:hypothetical protein